MAKEVFLILFLTRGTLTDILKIWRYTRGPNNLITNLISYGKGDVVCLVELGEKLRLINIEKIILDFSHNLRVSKFYLTGLNYLTK